jgi:hypothetical protein
VRSDKYQKKRVKKGYYKEMEKKKEEEGEVTGIETKKKLAFYEKVFSK